MNAPRPRPFLSIEGLTKGFDGVPAVERVNLEIAQGEIFALLGASGCGKSTLLRMVAGFQHPDAGQIVLDGLRLNDVPPYHRPINMMFQSYALFPHMTVEQNIAYGPRRDGLPEDQVQGRVHEMLDLVQLQGFGQRKPAQLSGGQQQRVALARSLARRPRLLLLDEPLGALDQKLREKTQMELVHILKSVGVTCLLVTHDQHEAMVLADRIGIMHQGQILQIGTPQSVYERPNCRHVAEFIGQINLIQGSVSQVLDGRLEVDTELGQQSVAYNPGATPGGTYDLAIRPEKISLSLHPPNDCANAGPICAGLNQCQVQITGHTYFGNISTYHLRHASGATLRATLANGIHTPVQPFESGTSVWASWHDKDIILVAP
jgi:putrescine transport system ATP-binding protein